MRRVVEVPQRNITKRQVNVSKGIGVASSLATGAFGAAKLVGASKILGGAAVVVAAGVVGYTAYKASEGLFMYKNDNEEAIDRSIRKVKVSARKNVRDTKRSVIRSIKNYAEKL